MPERIAKKPSDVVSQWKFKFYAAAKDHYIETETRKKKDQLYKLAGLVSLVGPPGEKQALEVYQTLCLVLMDAGSMKGKTRSQQWDRALEIIPADPEKLVQFSNLIQEYQAWSREGYFEGLKKAKVNLPTLVQNCLRVCEHHEAFIECAKSSWRKYPAQIFSEAVIREAAKTHPGAFGEFSDKDWWDDFEDVEVIE